VDFVDFIGIFKQQLGHVRTEMDRKTATLVAHW
jgi:hypothetical protein